MYVCVYKYIYIYIHVSGLGVRVVWKPVKEVSSAFDNDHNTLTTTIIILIVTITITMMMMLIMMDVTTKRVTITKCVIMTLIHDNDSSTRGNLFHPYLFPRTETLGLVN